MTLPESTHPSRNIPPPFQQMYICDPPESNPPSQIIPPFNKCILCATLQEYTSPSLNIPPLFNNYMRPSQNIPFPLRIYPPFQHMYMCDPPRIYPSLPEYTPLFKQLNATFPESTPLSTAIILCDAPRIYPSLPEYTPPPFQQLFITLPESTPPSQNIPTFQQLYYYTTLPESIPPSISPRIYPPPPFNNYMRHSQKLPLPPRIPPFFRQLYAPFSLRIYPSSPFYNYMRYSKNIALSH